MAIVERRMNGRQGRTQKKISEGKQTRKGDVYNYKKGCNKVCGGRGVRGKSPPTPLSSHEKFHTFGDIPLRRKEFVEFTSKLNNQLSIL